MRILIYTSNTIILPFLTVHNYWKSRYYRHRRKIFLKFFLCWVYFKFKSHTWTVKSNEWHFQYFAFILWNIIRFVRSTRWRKGKIKFYIREFILDTYISRDRKHRVSSPRGIEGFEKAAYLFEMPILPLLP